MRALRTVGYENSNWDMARGWFYILVLNNINRSKHDT